MIWNLYLATTRSNDDVNTLKIPHLKIAHQGGNLEVGNLDIQGYQDCPPQLFVVFCAHN